MAVTFDNNQNLTDMVHFDGTSTYTTRNLITGDFFNNNDVVGACIYFTWDRGVWHDLTVNVGTVLVADAITLAWEYYKTGVGWIAIPSVTDNTNSFKTAGANTISFAVPAEWAFQANIGLAANDGLMIRARITAVTNLTEGGANITTAVFGKDWAIKTTGDETLASIKTANDSGTWGVVNNTSNFYEIISNLRLEGNLVIESQNLNIGTELNRRVFLKTSGILTLGNLDGSGNITKGSTIKYWNANTTGMSPYNTWIGTLNMYNSSIWKATGSFGDYSLDCVLDIQSSVLENTNGTTYITSGCSGSVKNITFVTPAIWLYIYTYRVTIDNLIFGNCIGILGGVNLATITNTNFGTTRRLSVGNSNVSLYALNCSFDNPATQAYSSGTSNKIYIKYSLDLTVLDKNNNPITGYEVKLTDSQGNVINDGAWSNQDIVTYLSETDASVVKTDTDYNPFTIEIKKSGYKTYYSKITFTDDNRTLTITLQKVKDSSMSKRVNING